MSLMSVFCSLLGLLALGAGAGETPLLAGWRFHRGAAPGAEAAAFDDGEETPVFAKVQQSGGETQTKKGVRFAIECFFHGDDGEASGGRGR